MGKLMDLILIHFLLIIIGIIASIHVTAQTEFNNSLQLKKRLYKTAIRTLNSKEKISGYLTNVSDSDLYLSSSRLNFGSLKHNDVFYAYSFHKLETVTFFHKKGAIGRGILVGAVTGLVVGFVVARSVAKYEHDLQFTAATSVFFSFMILGPFAGGIIGAELHKRFTIGGSKHRFDSMRQSILRKKFNYYFQTAKDYSKPSL